MLNISEHDGVARIALAHGKVNVMDLELCRAVAEAFHAERDARGVVLTGEGASFSAGVDLKRMLTGGPAYVTEFIDALVGMFMAAFNHPGPVVAAINGHAIAGGCVLAGACDQRIMADGRGRIGIPELQIGVPFPVEGLEIMRFLLSSRHVSEVVYGGGTWQAKEALAKGLVDEVCEAEDLADRADTAVRHMLRVPADVFAVTKRQLHQSVHDAIERSAHINDRVNAIWVGSQTQDIVRAYLEKTFGKS